MDKKKRIMAAAEKLFTTGQFHEITLDAVSELADVGKGTIYEYFASKDDLFFQTAIAAFEQMCALLSRGSAATERSVEQGLRTACEAICKFVEERRPLFRLMHAEGERALGRGGGLRKRWNQHRGKMVSAVAEIIRRGVHRGQVRDDISAEAMAEYFLGLLRTKFNELEGQAEADRSPRALVSLFVRGLGNHGQAPIPRTKSVSVPRLSGRGMTRKTKRPRQ
jgi:TetR/AcrR family fatty acid metabolism transcriptional regulator